MSLVKTDFRERGRARDVAMVGNQPESHTKKASLECSEYPWFLYFFLKQTNKALYITILILADYFLI